MLNYQRVWKNHEHSIFYLLQDGYFELYENGVVVKYFRMVDSIYLNNHQKIYIHYQIIVSFIAHSDPIYKKCYLY